MTARKRNALATLLLWKVQGMCKHAQRHAWYHELCGVKHGRGYGHYGAACSDCRKWLCEFCGSCFSDGHYFTKEELCLDI